MLGNLIEEGLIPTPTKTIKVSVRTWNTLKSMKKENETFDDVINELLMKRTKSAGNKDVKVIKYERKTAFIKTWYNNQEVAFEFEYNDVKGQKLDFELDVEIKKVFFVQEVLNPSTFFGVDNAHKHYSISFLIIYLKAVAEVLKKEFRALFIPSYDREYESYNNITRWRQLYYHYNLSEESFINDIEEPLRLNKEEKLPKEWQERINNSIVTKLIKGNKKE